MRKSNGHFVKSFEMSSFENIMHQINAFKDEASKLLHVHMLLYKSEEVYQTA